MHPTELLDPNAAPPPRATAQPAARPATARTYDERFDELATLAYRLAFRIVGRREDARDLSQEAMARAFAQWPRVEDKAAGWVSRVVTNLALDAVRRRKHRDPVPVDHPQDLAAVAVQRAELVVALRSLSRRQRDVVVLRYLADLSELETARTLGCGVGAVKKHASRGLEALRHALPLDDRHAGPPADPNSPTEEAP